MKKYFIFAIPVFAVLFYFFYQFDRDEIGKADVFVYQGSSGALLAKMSAETAKTGLERYRGLSEREELCPDCGMVFIFQNEGQKIFVMRKMNFPLDIIWIRGGKIVKIDENARPAGDNPPVAYQSGEAVDTVLEVNAGFCRDKDIAVGDEIEIRILGE